MAKHDGRRKTKPQPVDQAVAEELLAEQDVQREGAAAGQREGWHGEAEQGKMGKCKRLRHE